MSPHDTPPAFPLLDDAGSGLCLKDPGMGLRDYFAAHAMQGMQANFGANKWPEDKFAERAYAVADAMLEARAA